MVAACLASLGAQANEAPPRISLPPTNVLTLALTKRRILIILISRSVTGLRYPPHHLPGVAHIGVGLSTREELCGRWKGRSRRRC